LSGSAKDRMGCEKGGEVSDRQELQRETRKPKKSTSGVLCKIGNPQLHASGFLREVIGGGGRKTGENMGGKGLAVHRRGRHVVI